MVELLSIFDKFLGTAGETSSHDIIRQSVIILMGSLAKHLDKTDPKVTRSFFDSAAYSVLGPAETQDWVMTFLRKWISLSRMYTMLNSDIAEARNRPTRFLGRWT